MNRITIFTPTYNRAYCLSNCYESMKRQTRKEFVWLIIDDGSTDETRKLVKDWQNEQKDFTIRYIYKKNGGMHTAYNTAYKNIDTELSMNVDSDDYLTDNAIEKILDFWDRNKRDDIGGILSLDIYNTGEIIGGKFPDDLKEFKGWGYKVIKYQNNGEWKKFVCNGDKKFIGVTNHINEYPLIPVFPGEKYHSLYYKQHYLERDYSILILNTPVCVVEYLEDGSTKNMYFQYKNNPNGFCDERKFNIKYAPMFSIRFKEAIHYVAESILAKDKHFITHSTNVPLTIMVTPIGICLYLLIQWKTRERGKKTQ